MSKSDLITWLATLPEEAPELERVDAIRRGVADAGSSEGEAFLSLKELSQSVRRHPVWLSRIGIQSCGIRIAGRLSYRLCDALAYLGGPECAARIAAVREERRVREARKVADI